MYKQNKNQSCVYTSRGKCERRQLGESLSPSYRSRNWKAHTTSSVLLRCILHSTVLLMEEITDFPRWECETWFCPSPILPRLPVAAPEIGTHQQGNQHSPTPVVRNTIKHACHTYYPQLWNQQGYTRIWDAGGGHSAHRACKWFISFKSLGWGREGVWRMQGWGLITVGKASSGHQCFIQIHDKNRSMIDIVRRGTEGCWGHW